MAEPHAHTVLVVDDDDDNLTVLLLSLEARGCTVHGASTGDHALRILGSGVRPCVAVVDVIMPGMNGYDLVTRIRADVNAATLPVVLYTGALEDPARVRALYVQAVLRKPCTPSAMAAAVAAHCRHRDV